uniref:Uncharacterized protein n=1 Tax=Coleopteran rhabdo-related virus OKIAV20 TaxID=2746287 RepID=A0A7D7EYJ9_9RHAB|nr:hypothetical protein [Coleopteran rhabdo-related virus OKIAV20]
MNDKNDYSTFELDFSHIPRLIGSESFGESTLSSGHPDDFLGEDASSRTSGMSSLMNPIFKRDNTLTEESNAIETAKEILNQTSQDDVHSANKLAQDLKSAGVLTQESSYFLRNNETIGKDVFIEVIGGFVDQNVNFGEGNIMAILIGAKLQGQAQEKNRNKELEKVIQDTISNFDALLRRKDDEIQQQKLDFQFLSESVLRISSDISKLMSTSYAMSEVSSIASCSRYPTYSYPVSFSAWGATFELKNSMYTGSLVKISDPIKKEEIKKFYSFLKNNNKTLIIPDLISKSWDVIFQYYVSSGGNFKKFFDNLPEDIQELINMHSQK